MDGPIASAVVLPEEDLAPASPSSKRRQSSISEQNAKRPRLDEDAPNLQRDTASTSKPAPPVRRERGRERRLFGAVLGALSQAPSTTAAQKRRSDIEKRQLAQRQQESEENEQKRADRIARRKVQRAKEQRRFEEQSVTILATARMRSSLTYRSQMRLRHQNRLHIAHFLRTTTEPHLVGNDSRRMTERTLMLGSTTNRGKQAPKKKIASKTKSRKHARSSSANWKNSRLVKSKMPIEQLLRMMQRPAVLQQAPTMVRSMMRMCLACHQQPMEMLTAATTLPRTRIWRMIMRTIPDTRR